MLVSRLPPAPSSRPRLCNAPSRPPSPSLRPSTMSLAASSLAFLWAPTSTQTQCEQLRSRGAVDQQHSATNVPCAPLGLHALVVLLGRLLGLREDLLPVLEHVSGLGLQGLGAQGDAAVHLFTHRRQSSSAPPTQEEKEEQQRDAKRERGSPLKHVCIHCSHPPCRGRRSCT